MPVNCEREVFAHDTSRLARPGWSTTRWCDRYILRRLMIDRMTIAAVARELGLSWDTVNTIVIDATQTIVASDTTRLDVVRVIGVDEHRWPHTRHRDGDGFVTYFDHHASNGPIEAINGRLEALRRNALGFRNLTHYRIRSLLHCGNLIQQINAL